MFAFKCFPANMKCWPSAGLTLAYCLWRWPNIKPPCGQGYCLVFARFMVKIKFHHTSVVQMLSISWVLFLLYTCTYNMYNKYHFTWSFVWFVHSLAQYLSTIFHSPLAVWLVWPFTFYCDIWWHLFFVAALSAYQKYYNLKKDYWKVR